MNALTFKLKPHLHIKPSGRINCSRLTPDNLAHLSIDEIKNIKLIDKDPTKIADYFDVSGTQTSHIVFQNSTTQLEYIGHKMSFGQITVEGNCGDFLGAKMQGGTIICHGNAQDRVGDQMRRGLILIDGNAGEYCASRMVAGTIGVYGDVARYVGFGMKRGTILLTKTPALHATIADCGSYHLPFLALLVQRFACFTSQFNHIKSFRVQRYAGDLACNGNGEILICKVDGFT